MTRIVAGTLGGRRLAAPPGVGHPADLRPGPRGAVQHAGVHGGPRRRAVRRPLRRLRRGRAGGAVPRRRRTSCWWSPTRGPPGSSATTSPRSGWGRSRSWSPAGCRPRSPDLPEGGPYDVVFADPPYAVPDDELAAAAVGAGRRRLAGGGRGRGRRARHPQRAAAAGGRRHAGAQPPLRRDAPFGTVADHETCGLSRLVRPGHQRAPRHHRPGEPAVRRGHRRRAGQPVASPACSPSTSGIDDARAR